MGWDPTISSVWKKPTYLLPTGRAITQEKNTFSTKLLFIYWLKTKINLMQNIEINIHGFRFIEIETGYVAKPNRTAINRVPLSALVIFSKCEENKCKVWHTEIYLLASHVL